MHSQKKINQKAGEVKPTRFFHAVIVLLFLAAFMILMVVRAGSGPQIPLILATAVAAIIAALLGWSWNEILDAMKDGIAQALEAMLILLLIGCMVGVWIASGTVPAMIYYGLSILNARIFLMASMLICGIVSFAIGAWGTVGTIGIALMGIGAALQIPLPLVAGSIVSGSYFGDAVSPFSDATNLTSAVVGTDVFSTIRLRVIPVGCAFVLAAAVYLLIGWRYCASDGAVNGMIVPLQTCLGETYHISLLCLLPLLVNIVCIFLRFPAIPSMLLGIAVGAVTALTVQGISPMALLTVCESGNVCSTGMETVDTLLTAGGLYSMLNTISIVILAMAFGGLMQRTGMMRALAAPFVVKLRRFAAMNAVASLGCVLCNVILPDQYLGIMFPGKMLEEEYTKRSYDCSDMAIGLTGGAVSSPLVPWNTCGLYCCSILGVSAFAYARFSFFNLFSILALLLFGIVRGAMLEKRKKQADKQDKD